MRFRRSLRARVGVAFTLFGGLGSLLLAAGLFLASHDLGERLIDETLTAELEDYVSRRQRNPQSPPPDTATIRGYVRSLNDAADPDLPTDIAALAPGRHQIELQGTAFRAAVKDRAGERFYILYNESNLQRRERGFLAFLAISVVIASLLSAAAGVWLAGRAITPVVELAARVRSLHADDGPEPFALDFPQDEVGALASSIDHYLERLGAFIDRERAFTANVSHELRTPLAVIHGAVEVLLADTTLTESQRGRLERIDRAASDMTGLSEALLFLAREDEGLPVEPAHCEVGSVLRETVERVQGLFKSKPVSVELDARAHVVLPVPQALLGIVLGNLVHNAFSFTERGHVRIKLSSDSVTVEDTGSGMSTEELSRIFDRFYRGADSSGSGIGLSIVKRICEHFLWTTEFHSAPGIGTTVQLRFTADRTPSAPWPEAS
jgi:signal transduction histidine kinase